MGSRFIKPIELKSGQSLHYVQSDTAGLLPENEHGYRFTYTGGPLFVNDARAGVFIDCADKTLITSYHGVVRNVFESGFAAGYYAGREQGNWDGESWKNGRTE